MLSALQLLQVTLYLLTVPELGGGGLVGFC